MSERLLREDNPHTREPARRDLDALQVLGRRAVVGEVLVEHRRLEDLDVRALGRMGDWEISHCIQKGWL